MNYDSDRSDFQLTKDKNKQNINSQSSSWNLWTIPNALSILRLLMLAPTVWALLTNHNSIAFLLFVLSSMTDALDGWIARKYNQVSEWGKILDPIADKLTLNVLAMIMAFQGRIPLFLAIVMLSRDALILGGSLAIMASKTIVPQANVVGKVSGAAFFAMLCAGLLNVTPLLDNFLVPMVSVLLLISIVVYTWKFFIILEKKSRES